MKQNSPFLAKLFAIVGTALVLTLLLGILYANLSSLQAEATFRRSLRVGMSKNDVEALAGRLGAYDDEMEVTTHSPAIARIRFQEEPAFPCTSHGAEFGLQFDADGRLVSESEYRFESAC